MLQNSSEILETMVSFGGLFPEKAGYDSDLFCGEEVFVDVIPDRIAKIEPDVFDSCLIHDRNAISLNMNGLVVFPECVLIC